MCRGYELSYGGDRTETREHSRQVRADNRGDSAAGDATWCLPPSDEGARQGDRRTGRTRSCPPRARAHTRARGTGPPEAARARASGNDELRFGLAGCGAGRKRPRCLPPTPPRRADLREWGRHVVGLASGPSTRRSGSGSDRRRDRIDGRPDAPEDVGLLCPAASSACSRCPRFPCCSAAAPRASGATPPMPALEGESVD
jgi:hypothetical protein